MLTKTQKMLVITQLCLAFSLALWILFDPFMGEHFRIRGDLLLIENIQGDSALAARVEPLYRDRLLGQQALFHSLNNEEQRQIHAGRTLLQSRIETPFSQKALAGLYYFLVKTPFFELAWIFFSIVISILCLKGRDGAKAALFLLPLTVILYAADAGYRNSSQTKNLFPSEEELVTGYLKQPLSADLSLQKAELQRGFDLYLVEKWAKTPPQTIRWNFKSKRREENFSLIWPG